MAERRGAEVPTEEVVTSVLTLPTEKGRLTIEARTKPGKCDVCGLRGGGMADLEHTAPVVEGVEKIKSITICGNCLADDLKE